MVKCVLIGPLGKFLPQTTLVGDEFCKCPDRMTLGVNRKINVPCVASFVNFIIQITHDR